MWQLHGKKGIDLPQDPAMSLLDIYPNDASLYHRGTWSSLFIDGLFIIDRQPRCPSTDEWGKRCGLFIQWSTMQSLVKPWNSQVNWWTYIIQKNQPTWVISDQER